MTITPYRKAVAAAIVAFGGALATASIDGGVSAGEWFGIVAAALVAGGGVYAVPNTQVDDEPGKHAVEEN